MVGKSKIVWNPHTSGYFDNPYDHLKACREENPIHRILNDAWIFLRYSDVSQTLSSQDFMVSEFSQFLKEKEPYIFKHSDTCPYLSKGTKMWTMYLNDEVHKNARIGMTKSLNLNQLDEVMANAVDEINEKHQLKSSFDLVSYCGEFIYLILKWILGIRDLGSFETIKTYSNMLARVQDIYVPKQLYQKINEWFLSGKNIFTESEFRQNLVNYSTKSGINYTEDEIYSITSLVLMAAFETSKDNLSVALWEIMKSEEIQNHVETCSKKELNLLIEELFRFSSPLQYTIRVNKNSLETESGIISANSKIYLSLASANHDDTVFANPDKIVAGRTPNDHLAFGKGLHFCLGATIARLELRYCLKPMVHLLKQYKVEGSPDWSKQIFMRTMNSAKISKNK
ncbi:MAG: cytochrome P450 [Reichenbachiella sp.]|uniref:cytochrome P450 n=1 Tax=Reichenbachiella sp. TaxID=2184521 RepID=UPI002965FF72|nr:cytochrome P450 [Reichenbachiella sp.]MDW3209678.1 cytochrome P450 [Reichenbachiella sp.]